jgi:prevent-host-death family protein
MIYPTDIQPLTDFQRNTKAYLKQMKKTGRPTVLTVNGRAEAVVQDVHTYQKLLDRIAYMEDLEAIREGLADEAAGRVSPAAEVYKRLDKKIARLRKK